MDLNAKVFREHISSRRLFVLVKGLPAESNWVQWVSDDTNYNLASYNPNKIRI